MKILKTGKHKGHSFFDDKGKIVKFPYDAEAVEVTAEQARRLKKYKLEEIKPEE